MIVGFPPFYTGTNNNAKMYELIKKKQVYFPDPERHSISMSAECKDFISRLLDKKAATRLGTRGGIDEVLAHPWLDAIDADRILEKTIEAPVKPQLSADPLDVSQFDTAFTKEEAIISTINPTKMEKVINSNSQFSGFGS